MFCKNIEVKFVQGLDHFKNKAGAEILKSTEYNFMC